MLILLSSLSRAVSELLSGLRQLFLVNVHSLHDHEASWTTLGVSSRTFTVGILLVLLVIEIYCVCFTVNGDIVRFACLCFTDSLFLLLR